MKQKGDSSILGPLRDKELIKAFRRLAAAETGSISSDIYKAVVMQPCSRFWISEHRAAIMLSKLFNGYDVHSIEMPSRREMYAEIFRRAQILRSQRPDICYLDMAYIIINQPAPQFYMTYKSAIVILNNYRRRRRHRRRLTITSPTPAQLTS